MTKMTRFLLLTLLAPGLAFAQGRPGTTPPPAQPPAQPAPPTAGRPGATPPAAQQPDAGRPGSGRPGEYAPGTRPGRDEKAPVAPATDKPGKKVKVKGTLKCRTADGAALPGKKPGRIDQPITCDLDAGPGTGSANLRAWFAVKMGKVQGKTSDLAMNLGDRANASTMFAPGTDFEPCKPFDILAEVRDAQGKALWKKKLNIKQKCEAEKGATDAKGKKAEAAPGLPPKSGRNAAPAEADNGRNGAAPAKGRSDSAPGHSGDKPGKGGRPGK